jgi:hypothetical protein
MFLATASGPTVRHAIAGGQLGQMVTPDAGNRVVNGARWALDNGCFSDRWTPERWLATLDRHQNAPDCLYAVVPDVVADARATNERWARWHGAARNRGYRCAYVLQNGCRSIPASAGAVFVGGDDRFKLGPEVRALVALAKRRRLWVHMGRVNSLRRLRYAAWLGCDSVDGTFLAFGPDRNLPQLLRWLRLAAEPTLFGGAA